MPSYNTRLRSNSVLLPPRRLRHSPTPPPRHARPRQPVLPPFPPPNVVLHPDDAANKTLIAIGRALLAVDNRAITIKDLSQLSLDCGLLSQNVSAASQAITTFIRNHLNRCLQEHTTPLLLSISLTGTPADDRLAPALHSRSGGTSAVKDHDPHALTTFRRGTVVWYLSELAGAPCPFKRAGLPVNDILHPQHGAKRKRDPPQSRPGPAMATRTRSRILPGPAPDPPLARLRVKLTVRVPEPEPEPESEDSDSGLSDALSSISDPVSVSSAPPSPAPPCPTLPPYPILSPSIPSPPCPTPATPLASPSAPSASFLPVHTALSNPPRDYRSRSCSLPFSSASPPPDSEDEDHDFHNSMVGLRRGSVPLLKREEEANWSTPLEPFPGFAPFQPAPVKPEPTSAVLPPPSAQQWDHGPRWDDRWNEESRWTSVKPEHPSDDERTVLDPEDETPAWAGKGTHDDPVRIDPAVGDVELLGPESVRSRELDAAWGAAPDVPMDVDCGEPCAQEMELRASSAETLDTVPTTTSSSPLSDESMSLDCAPFPFVMHSLRPCDPPVVATVVEGIPVYHTLLAPGVPLLRRIDTALVALAPLLAFLGLPPAGAHAWAPLAVAQTLARARPGVPPGVRDVFLRADLGVWFPDALARLVQRHAGALEAGIRAEDVFAPRGGTAEERDAEVVLAGGGAVAVVVFDAPAEAVAVPCALDEQEDALFRSFVDFAEPPGAAAAAKTVAAAAAAAATASAHSKENVEKEKENASAGAGGRRRPREKAALEGPVRRSKRASAAGAAKLMFPVTRSRARAAHA